MGKSFLATPEVSDSNLAVANFLLVRDKSILIEREGEDMECHLNR